VIQFNVVLFIVVPTITSPHSDVIRSLPTLNVNLKIEYFGVPNPTLSWSRNNMGYMSIVSNTSNYMIYTTGNSSILSIMQAIFMVSH